MDVTPAETGNLPRFAGSGGEIHGAVIDRMYDVLDDTTVPAYLDEEGRLQLELARRTWRVLELGKKPLFTHERNHWVAATRAGTATQTTLKTILERHGWKVTCWHGFLQIEAPESGKVDPRPTLREVAARPPAAAELLTGCENLRSEKHHEWFTPQLLAADLASSTLDVAGAAAAAERLAEAAA